MRKPSRWRRSGASRSITTRSGTGRDSGSEQSTGAEAGGSFAIGGPIYLSSYQACCHLRSGGVTYCCPDYTTYGMAWSDDAQDYGMAKLPSDKSNHIECVHLIVNGTPVDDLNYGADMGGKRARQAIGAKEGRFAYIATEVAYTPEQLRDVLAGCRGEHRRHA